MLNNKTLNFKIIRLITAMLKQFIDPYSEETIFFNFKRSSSSIPFEL